MILITQYYCDRFSNCMLELGLSYLLPLDRGQIAFDLKYLKWRCMDVYMRPQYAIFL